MLRFLVAANDYDATRDMSNAHRGVGRVDALTAWARSAHNVNTQVFLLVDVDLDLIGFRQYRDRDGRRMNTSRCFGSGNTLDAMNAAFELKPAVGAAPGNCCDYFLDTAEA